MDEEENTILTSFGVILIWLAILIPLWLIAGGVVFYVYEAYATRQPTQSSIQLAPAPPALAPPDGARG